MILRLIGKHGVRSVSAVLVVLGAGAFGCKQTSSGGGSNQLDSSAAGAAIASSPAVNPSWNVIEQTAVSASNYTMLNVPSDGVENYMIPGSADQAIPANLQGIWWMDGNSLAPGNVTSFARMQWDLPNHRVLVQEYGANNYTLNGDSGGIKSFNESVAENLSFEVQFNDGYTHGQLVEVLLVPHTSIVMRFPTEVINYQMDLAADGDWLRTSWWGPKRLPDYHMRRIVDAQGKRIEPAYTNFLKIAPVNSYIPELKPYVQNGTGTVPTVDP